MFITRILYKESKQVFNPLNTFQIGKTFGTKVYFKKKVFFESHHQSI